MSKMPGGYTATIDCMIISGFPGIGKTTTFSQIKKGAIGAKVVDMDVKDYGTTNGINVANPATYVARMKELSRENSLIFCTIDPAVRAKMVEARLFYIIVVPEIPPKMKEQIPHYRPDPFVRAQYMRRFTENLGYNSKAAQALDGKGYDACIEDLFQDPMPHIITPVLNMQVIDYSWHMVDNMTRTTLGPDQLQQLQQNQPTPPKDM